MKISVSIPDDLWAEANPDDSSGPSDTVQRALHLLRDEMRAARRPLANAPVQSNLERYQPMFDQAVEATAKSVNAVLDNGYRFGLLLAPGLTPVDFELIDRGEAQAELQELVSQWGEEGVSAFSWEFAFHVQQILDAYSSDEDPELRTLLREVLGSEDSDAWSGVVWSSKPGKSGPEFPQLTDTFVKGVLAALTDVRDEATRRISELRGDSGE